MRRLAALALALSLGTPALAEIDPGSRPASRPPALSRPVVRHVTSLDTTKPDGAALDARRRHAARSRPPQPGPRPPDRHRDLPRLLSRPGQGLASRTCRSAGPVRSIMRGEDSVMSSITSWLIAQMKEDSR